MTKSVGKENYKCLMGNSWTGEMYISITAFVVIGLCSEILELIKLNKGSTVVVQSALPNSEDLLLSDLCQ